jgi:predicted nucleotidyltransferase
MDRKKYIFDLFRQHRQELLQIGVAMIGLFGSIVRGDDSENSDYDILVEFAEGRRNYKSFNQLCDFLEKYIGENYDLVTRQGLSSYLRESILKEVEYVNLTS